MDEVTQVAKPPVSIWRFYDAPAQFQALSTSGGDEDWLLVCEPDAEGTASWLAETLAVCGFERHEYTNKVHWLGEPQHTLVQVIFITAHS